MVRAILGIQVEEMGLTDNSWATNGSEALTLLKRNPADLIICGVSVPEMDALELLKACKEHPRLTKIPFIIMDSGEVLRAKALEAGMDAYIVNPFSPGELLEALKEIGAWPSPMPLLGKSKYQGASTMSSEDSDKSAYRTHPAADASLSICWTNRACVNTVVRSGRERARFLPNL